MRTIREPARDVPVAGEYDVLVAGGGPAGIGAALGAARAGARTMLVEQAGVVGGVATSGMMSHWTGGTRGGIYEEILDRSADPDHPDKRKTIHPERLRALLMAMLAEAGVAVRLYTFAAAPVMDGKRVVGVFTESKSGREAFLARTVVDATADGDIAARAGAPFSKGRESDHRMQPMTLMFKVGGVDTARAILPGSFETTVDVPKGEIQALAREHLPHPAGHVLLYPTTLPGVVTCNMTNVIDVDGTSAADLTRAEAVCQDQVGKIVRFLREFAPGYEKCHLLAAASQVGVRETRHFEGDYALTEHDILEARRFPDWIATHCQFNFDIHNLDGAGLDKDGVQKHFHQDKGYTIPYGCLLPKGIEGLLLSGRMISGTHKAHSSFRVMPICMHTGQAAGVAGALAAKNGTGVRDVPVAEIQRTLLLQGMQPPDA